MSGRAGKSPARTPFALGWLCRHSCHMAGKVAEHVGILAVVVLVGRFRDIVVGPLIGVVMMLAIPCSLDKGPEALDRVSVGRSSYVFPLVVNGVVAVIPFNPK